jgi:hypothetical protein
MSGIQRQMEELLGEGTRVEQEGSEEVDVNLKALAPQLVLAMQTMGLDPSEEEHIDAFLKSLKTLATSKSTLLKQALKRWSGARASKAVKLAKAAL